MKNKSTKLITILAFVILLTPFATATFDFCDKPRGLMRLICGEYDPNNPHPPKPPGQWKPPDSEDPEDYDNENVTEPIYETADFKRYSSAPAGTMTKRLWCVTKEYEVGDKMCVEAFRRLYWVGLYNIHDKKLLQTTFCIPLSRFCQDCTDGWSRYGIIGSISHDC